MARESQFTKSMKQSYAVQNLDLEHTYKKTAALLKVYRNAYWSLSEDFRDLEEYSYVECEDSDTVVNYLLTFAPEKELRIFSDRVQNAAESRVILNMIRKAALRIKDYPNDGTLYYDIIDLTYLGCFKYPQEAVLEMLDLERSTYFRKKKEAITLIGYILFGRIVPEFGKNPAL